MKKFNPKKVLILILLLIVIAGGVVAGAIAERLIDIKPLNKFFPPKQNTQVEIVSQGGDVSGVVKKVGPSVVTVSAVAPVRQVIQFSPFGGFSQGTQGGTESNIGSGFIVSADGLIVTNKHVVSDNTLSYKVSTSDGKTYDVKSINRDPNNDIAVLKIDAGGLTPVTLGDSGNLEVGQFVIAIGTALGEFKNTVTTGVISGLGRGISAGSIYQGYVEQLDNVIQTDAAINPGNSGGPLLNASGHVIGVNVAVAQGANNIAFSIPINTVKTDLDAFKATGKFPAKAYMGVEYQVLTQQAALLNSVPRGMYVVNVISGSPAEKAGILVGDIIYKIDGAAVGTDSDSLSKLIADKKPGDTLSLDIWRNGESTNLKVTLSESSQ